MGSIKNHSYAFGRLLVFAQFFIIASILIVGTFPRNPIQIICLFMGLSFGFWAIAAMRVNVVSIFPEPENVSELVMRGPYAFVRHPMYTAVLLSTASFMSNLATYLLWLILLLVLTTKINYEERLLVSSFPEYVDYKSKTKKLVPFIY